jgi:tetratricopeptide (TPR) repeat protein
VFAAASLRADSDTIASAKGLYERFRYEQAYEAFNAVLERPGHSPDEIADIYLHLGLIAAAMDRQQDAVEHFTHLLCVKPDAKLAEGLSPKVAGPFKRAQERAAALSPMRVIHIPVSALAAEGGLDVEAELQPGELGMAHGLTLKYRAAGQPDYGALRKDGQGPLVLSVSPAEIPPGVDAEYFLQVHNRFGSVLWELGTSRAPMRARAAAPAVVDEVGAIGAGAATPTVDDDEGAFFTRPWFLIAAGAAAVVLIAGGVTTAVLLATAPDGEGSSFGGMSQEY